MMKTKMLEYLSRENMKYWLLVLFLLIFIPTHTSAFQNDSISKKAEKISESIKAPLYSYDLSTVSSIISSLVADDKLIEAVELINNTDKTIFQTYKENGVVFPGKTIPSGVKARLKHQTHTIIFDQEEIGELRLYYKRVVGSGIILTEEEQNYISQTPIIRVGNEMDWPPFDFAENGKPMGYSVEFIELVAQKVGLEIEFINGYTWVELVTKLKVGELDALPAIYKTEERESFLSFTSEYYSQPSVMVVNSNNNTLNTLQDLSGKRLAAIKGFAITDVMAKKHPEIELYLVDALLDGIMAVSTGQADAFIDSIGNISYLTEKNFIPNVTKVRGSNPLPATT